LGVAVRVEGVKWCWMGPPMTGLVFRVQICHRCRVLGDFGLNYDTRSQDRTCHELLILKALNHKLGPVTNNDCGARQVPTIAQSGGHHLMKSHFEFGVWGWEFQGLGLQGLGFRIELDQTKPYINPSPLTPTPTP
jgi:hypothetical protein